MRFKVSPPGLLARLPEWDQAYITGIDKRVFACRVESEGDVLTLRRQKQESGKLHICWPVEGYGCPVAHTCSLPEREEPYILPMELARGKIARLRDQLGAWQVAGMVIPRNFHALRKDAQHLLAKAVQQQDDLEECGKLSQKALTLAYQAAELLSAAYTQQRLEIYRRRSTQLPSLLGCDLGDSLPQKKDEEAFVSSFNAAFVSVEWRNIEPEEGAYDWDRLDQQVEWCQAQKLFMHAGPLLDLTDQGMPNWLSKWKDDFLNMQSFVSDFVETAITRYFGKIRYWEVSAYGNTGGALDLTEEQRLTLTARTLEIARQVDDEIQLSIRIEQPWGGYLSNGEHRLSPLQFIDAIIRSGVGLSTVNVELGVGFAPRKTGYRDLLEISELFDLWGSLGIPLQVTLAYPSGTGDDPDSYGGMHAAETDSDDPPTPEKQAEWTRKVVPLLMAKQSVVGIYWTNYDDRKQHRYPFAGMIDADGKQKPALGVFDHYLNEFWSKSNS
ncbi:MAG: endo-1,4-beta-xylanase [Planctomycetaceae bacterium]|nr:endo-1,4-beta-xylanase [Planctomycetaceae bacterium]